MKGLTALAKGLITTGLMLALSMYIFYARVPATSKLNWLVFILFGAGILWTVIEYGLFINPSAKFGDLFGQGFRCFIIVTLAMTLFTAAISLSHPEFAEIDAKNYREYLDAEAKDKLPAERDKMAAEYKKHYTSQLIYTSIFGYLVVGSIVTAAGSAILLLRKK